MKALTPSEAARRNFFEIQNSSSKLKVSLEVVGRNGTFEVSISIDLTHENYLRAYHHG